MSIASEITRISGNVADAYTAANAKGATMPVTQNSDNLATTISTIQTGTTPTGTKSITSNGVYDVTDFASADVQVPTTAPAYYIEKTKDANGVAQNSSYLMDFSTFTDIGSSVFAYAYADNTNITGTIDFSSLATVSGYRGLASAFSGCTGITSVDLSALTTVSSSSGCNGAFYGCTGLTGTLDLSSLTTVSGQQGCASMFYGCTGITSIDLSSMESFAGSQGFSNTFEGCTGLTSVNLTSLTSISAQTGGNRTFAGCTGLNSFDLSSLTCIGGTCGNMFDGCTNLASVDISHLAKLGQGVSTPNATLSYMFRNCTSLTELRFNNLAYTTINLNGAFMGTLLNVTGCTVHFPSDWQTAMASYSNITNGLGGTNTTVLFDLPAVTTLDLSKIINIKDSTIMSSFGINNNFPNVTSVNLGSLKTVSGYQGCYSAFQGSTNITSFDLSSLTTVSGYSACENMFSGCTGLTGAINLSSLTTISGLNGCRNMFMNCTGITSVDLSSLTTVSGNSGCLSMFYGCTGLTELRFPSLTTVSSHSVFTNMVFGTTGVTVHFPSNFATTVPVATLGGTNTTVLYDLPATA